MSLPHILLGILTEPRSGYEIKQLFDGSLRHFWFAELSQIYPALKKLESGGFLLATTAPSDKGPDKRVYSRTEAGRAMLMDWLAEGPVNAPVRHGFMAQVFFMNEQTDPRVALSFFRDLKDRYSLRRQTLQAIEDGWRADCPGYPDTLDSEDFYKQLTLDIGLQLQKTYEDWCERSIQRLEKRVTVEA